MDIIDNIIIISTTPEKDKHLYGLGLESGVTLIPPKYENVKFPIGDIFMFKQDGKWGLVNLDGAILLQPEYDNIFSWNKDYVVVAEGQPFHYKCGAVDWNGKEIIPAEYAAIGLTDYSVFRCYTGAEYDWGRNHQMDSLKYDGNPYLWKNSRNETLSKQLQIWRNKQQVANCNGWLILDNQILLNPELESQKWVSDKDLNFIQVTPGGTLITKDKRGKYGLRDLYGKSIILQIYDDMKLMASGIVVLYNGKIGIIGTNGNSILPTEYLEIRDNIIDESNKKEIKGDWSWIWNVKNGFVYRYSKDHPLDTSNLETIIVRSDFFVSDGTIACCKNGESKFNTFITRNRDGENIFSIENGFVLGENADRIIPLTSDDYLIQNGDKFRLVSTNLDSNSLSIEFDEAKYYGEGILYYQVDGLWGIKLFSPKLYDTSLFRIEKDIDIVPSYLSIKPVYGMMGILIYFEIQNSYKMFSGEEGICSQLIKTSGECLLGGNHQYTGSFSIHDSIIRCQVGLKFGFVDFDDETIIPFKFDEIVFRGKGKHGGFNVRIGDFWGILKHNGKESHIKYSKSIPFRDKYEIVIDALTGLKGVLNTETCEEVVPCLYTHIILEENRAIVARGGCPEDNCIVDYLYAKWGCYDTLGKLIVPVRYDYIKIDGEYVLA
nr:WG repeat-containing protein [Bacteroides acidifaciens]